MSWWYTQDEEWWNGPCETREDAIADGREDYGADNFEICEAEQGMYGTPRFYDIEELMNNINEERTDPNGDGIFHSGLRPEQEHALEHAVREAIQTWMEANGMRTTAWAFENMRNRETIPGVDEPETAISNAEIQKG